MVFAIYWLVSTGSKHVRIRGAPLYWDKPACSMEVVFWGQYWYICCTGSLRTRISWSCSVGDFTNYLLQEEEFRCEPKREGKGEEPRKRRRISMPQIRWLPAYRSRSSSSRYILKILEWHKLILKNWIQNVIVLQHEWLWALACAVWFEVMHMYSGVDALKCHTFTSCHNVQCVVPDLCLASFSPGLAISPTPHPHTHLTAACIGNRLAHTRSYKKHCTSNYHI